MHILYYAVIRRGSRINGINIPEGDTTGTSTPTWKFNGAEYWKIIGPIILTNRRGCDC